MRSIKLMAAVLVALATMSMAAPRSSSPKPMASASRAADPDSPSSPLPVATALTADDVNAWLDGIMPYALSSGDIAGAVVVVVKDGQVLTEKGYGFADVKTRRKVDPQRTLFRPGSVAKLFTWTAVMQQVELGKLDLDRDVNAYLDFKIPPREGRPVTLRNLMTHTGGFEDYVKALLVAEPGRLKPIGQFLKSAIPNRVFPPGEVPAYSNYGATLAGYIVQRVSGEAFDDYVERHIFTPLRMTRSTFRQPLPTALRADMSLGYSQASRPARPFELVSTGPAGALSTTGEDMAHFMIAHLQDGRYGSAQILRPATAEQMHRYALQLNPPLDGMALGFYHEDRNGRRVIAHEGDTEAFHADLHLLLDDRVGLFIDVNSAGKAGAAGGLRTSLYRNFMVRYFPAPRVHLPTASTAKTHAQLMVGHYQASRRSDSGFFRIFGLISQAKVTSAPDGTLQVSDFVDFAGAPKRWREVGPFVWKDQADDSTMAAVVKDGRVVSFSNSDAPPVSVMQPVPGWFNSAWNLPLLFATLAVLILNAVLWPVRALVRRRYGHRFELTGRRALVYRLAHATAIIDLAAVVAYVMVLSAFFRGGLANLDTPLDPLIRLAQMICLVGVAGAIAAVWNAVAVWTDRGCGWWTRLSETLLALACVAFAWFVLILHLVTTSLNY